jgi:hypothetical protein
MGQDPAQEERIDGDSVAVRRAHRNGHITFDWS